MSTKITLIVTAVVIIAAIIAGALLWNQLPDPMASHWNEQDQVNGYMSRFWGVFLMPIACVGLMAFFLAIPQIDPLRQTSRNSEPTTTLSSCWW